MDKTSKMIIPRKKFIIRITLAALAILLLVGGGIAYAIFSGRLSYKADTAQINITNIVEGTYSSDGASGEITSAPATVTIDFSK